MESPLFNPKASQETIISLLQLEPTPIESPISNEKGLPSLPEEDVESAAASVKSRAPSGPASSGLGLSGSRHGSVYYLTRIQKYSAYAFSIYAGVHMVNTSVIPLIYKNVHYSEPFLLLSRELYQTKVTEPLLIGLPILAHVGSGIALRLVRRWQNVKRYGGATPGLHAFQHVHMASTNGSPTGTRIWPLLSNVSISGYIFTGLLATHVTMNRLLPLIVEGDSSNIGLQYVSHGFARHGLQAWVAYTALLSVGVGHMVWGWAKWWNVAPPMNWKKTTFDRKLRKRRRRMWWGINLSAAALAGLWAAGGLGVVARAGPSEGWLGTLYDGIYSRIGQ